MSNNFAPDYVDVATRMHELKEKHPEASLQPFDPAVPYRVERIGDETYIVVVAACYRTPDDPRPGVGMAYETYPGKTPYTRGSELQNAETSAWGRAIMAALAADSRRGIASADEVRNRVAERQQQDPKAALRAEIAAAGKAKGMTLDEIADDFAGYAEGVAITDADESLLSRYLTVVTA